MAENKYTKEQVDQYVDYVKKQQASKFTPEQMTQYEDYIRKQMPVESPSMLQKIVTSAPVDYTLRGLDYAGGLGRLAASGLVNAAQYPFTGESLNKETDILDALKGHAPSTSEYMKRAGVEDLGALSDVIPGAYSETGEGLRLKKGGLLDPTGRGTIGMAGDVAFDPLTYLTLGGSAVAKAGKVGKVAEKVLKPTANIAESTGKSIYKSGLKSIDQQAMKYGKEPVSDTLMKYGISGSAESIYKQMDDLAETLVGQQKDILSRATQAGGQANMSKAMQGTIDKIAELRATKDPMLQPVADALEAEVVKYTKLDPRLVPAPNAEYLSKAKTFDAEKAKYLEDVSNYRKARNEYKKAGATETQNILPGQTDIGQRAGTVQEQIPLIGEDIAMKAEQVVQDPFQYSLTDIPQKTVNVKGGRSTMKKDNTKKLTSELMNQEPKFGYQQLKIENVAPSEIEKALVELPGIKQAPEGFQTSMLLEPPTKPTRPRAPEMPMQLTPGINPEQISKMKTSIYEALPKGAYQEMVSTAMGVSPQLTKGKRTMAQGLKTETEDAVGRVLGAGEQAKLVDLNKELGQVLTSKDKQMTEAFKEANKNAFTSVDAVLAASQIPKDQANWWLLGLKKAADIAKMTGPRTNVGKGLYKFGTSGAPASAADIYLRRNLINENQGE
jgi:hypothetical protein